MGLLGRLVSPTAHVAKIIDGLHPGVSRPGAEESTPTDILPLPEGQERQTPHCKLNILVAVTGTDLDKELVSLACNLAKKKHVSVFAAYGIPVPRTLPVDADMPTETRQANEALLRAEAIADRSGSPIETEIIQSRHFGQSLVEEAGTHECALVVLGLPYRVGRQGQFELGETADYVLKNAPCRVWVVRGEPPSKPEPCKGEKSDTPERVDQQRATV
ncbi:MAG: universal stress protein [Ktedonobacterales bacterium]|nr:universal stress protein [Ktedonobacterales bacterium]